MDIMVEDKEEIVVDNQFELDVNGQEEEQIYPMNGIKVDKGFYTVFELKRRYDAPQKRIILDSDFQRESVWNQQRKAELIESVLMGLPLPIFYFNQDKYGRLIVVDGRQRLTALFEYMNDGFALNKLKILPKMNGLRFSELPSMMSGRIEDYQLQAHVILPPTPDRIKFDIFDRVNRGGVQLNKQEIRNALYQGEATRFLNRLVKSQEFMEATGYAFEKEKRMKDKYLINRFIAAFLYRNDSIIEDDGSVYVYKDDIDELLGKALDSINHMSSDEIKDMENMVLSTLNKSFFYMGKDAFRLIKEGRRTPINMNVFETIMYALLFVPEMDVNKKKAINMKIAEFLNHAEFRENIGNHRDSAAKFKWRLDCAERIGRSFL
ncbi:MAG: DUF262 domain-containing protein [Clostridiales bacterium]|nr:DUF262 domain-containing protein [Clostridiales bacterium]